MMNIKELEITKEMYFEAKRIENLYHLTDKFEVKSEEFKKYNNEWIKADEEFQKNFSDEFDTLEIVNEYERRKKNEVKNTEEIELLKKFQVIPQWTTGMKTTNGSMWTKKFIEAGYISTGWRFCDRCGDWWDEYTDGKEFIYAEQCVRYIVKYKNN